MSTLAPPTAAEFLERISAEYVGDLTRALEAPIDTPAATLKIELALADAHGELMGWMPRIPAKWVPQQITYNVHCRKVALYMLTLDRPGQEFAQIRAAYDDTITFYKHLVEGAAAAGGAPPVEGSACAPPPVFTRHSLKGFADG